MDPIEFLILITVAITLFELSVVCYSILNFFFLTPIYGPEGMLLPTEWANALIGLSNQLAAKLIPVYIVILLFYVIMYIIYLIIINVIPETGPKSFFIPIREILLKIPPIPSFIKYGIFKLMDDIVYSFGLTNIIKIFLSIVASVFNFSRDNIKRILIFLLPDYESNINDFDYKMQKEEEERGRREIEKEQMNNKKEMYDQIEDENDICVSQKAEIMTPDKSSSEVLNDNVTDMYNTIDCQSKAVGNYIKSNN